MHNQNLRLFLYSALAIIVMTLAWGVTNIPKQRELAEQTLKGSLEQEIIVLSGAVKSSVQAMRYRLLDVLKAEGQDRASRAFQDSPFVTAALFEAGDIGWKSLWHSAKAKEGFQTTELRDWMKEWPLAKLTPGETYFARVGKLQGEPHFAIVVAVRRASNTPMLGVGIFSAGQLGLALSAERTREITVIDDKGYALALSRPAYLGVAMKRDGLVAEMLEADQVSARREWEGDNGVKMAGVATRVSDTNLIAMVESPLKFPKTLAWASWLYLFLSGAGAIALNWWLLNSLIRPLLTQISQSDQVIEQLKRALNQREPIRDETPAAKPVVEPEIEDFSFATPARAPEPEVPAKIPLAKVVAAALRSLDGRIKETGIQVQVAGLDSINLSSDALQLQTAIEEVLKNAIEAMESTEPRSLAVIGKSTAGRVHLTIEDSGEGIEPQNLNKVFDPFYSTKDAQGVSRGLGLNVVRRVIEELHGHVEIGAGDAGGTVVELQWPEETTVVPQKIEYTEVGKPAVAAIELDEEDDFETMIMQAPLVPSAQRELSNSPVRKPKVRALD